jgi:hypothetical protein
MSDEIRQRIEKLIGEGPSESVGQAGWQIVRSDFLLWRTQLIDRLTEESCLVYSPDGEYFGIAKDSADKVVGVLIDCQPIKRGVRKSEIVKCLTERNGVDFGLSIPLKQLADRIEREGIIND